MKNRFLRNILIVSVLLLNISHSVCKTLNEPDSVFLLAYSENYDEGRGGLKFAWSCEKKNWHSVADGYAYLKCDYGRWGDEKRMVAPMLVSDAEQKRWCCVWRLNKGNEEYGCAFSDDLLKWGRQSYFVSDEYSKYIPSSYMKGEKMKAVVNGKNQYGYVQKVKYELVNKLIQYAEHKKYRQNLNNEVTAQDKDRFADIVNVKGDIIIFPDSVKKISDKLIGIFFEDINYSADGGIYAELIQNRDFEYSQADVARSKNWDSTYAWSVKGDGMTLNIKTDNPIHNNNKHYAYVNVERLGASLCNEGYDGISLIGGEEYIFSIFSKSLSAKNGKIRIELVSDNGNVLASSVMTVGKSNWHRTEMNMKALSSSTKCHLAITPLSKGEYAFDMVSLFPVNTFKNRKNGMRKDIAMTLAELKPKFVRFPGGCVAHGDGIDNMYDWKGSIGELQSRKPLRNLWGYHQTRGLGYYEYFQFCEDIGAEPLPVLAAGVPCQNSGTCSTSSVRHIDCGGQQGGIPMDKMDKYVQDVLDLIEYANGDAKKTYWGKVRAKSGHPKPFNLKSLGIGNEDLITDVFEERFTLIFNAVKKKYPEITVVGTVGPFYEGTDYDEGWKLAEKLQVPMVDEHYYNAPGWFINNQNFYDRYDRNKSKVYLGEYASHLPQRQNNIETALSEALYLASVERNADVVEMTSYAPLLAKKGHTQWKPDLIYFNNEEVMLTTDYYVQKMYSANSGDKYVASAVHLNKNNADLCKRVASSVVIDSKSGDYIVKLVNMTCVDIDSNIKMPFLNNQDCEAQLTLLCGNPSDKDVVPSEKTISVNRIFNYKIPAYSFSVIRIKR